MTAKAGGAINGTTLDVANSTGAGLYAGAGTITKTSPRLA